MNTEDLSLFHRIVETGSLLEASVLLNLPKSTVSRRLKNLEDDVSIKLFHRASRSLSLTSAGSHFYEKTLKLVDDLNATLEQLTDPTSEVSGHLRVQLFPIPDTVALTQKIFRFMDLNPKLSVELITTAEPLDMIKHNIDVAFRIEFSFDEPDMVARPVITSNISYYASPEFLSRYGTPVHPLDLENYNMVMFRFPNGKMFNELPIDNDQTLVNVSGNICTNSVLLAREAAIQGRGIAFLSDEICDDHIASGELVRLFDSNTPFAGRVLLVYPATRYVNLATKRFIDYIMAELTQDGLPSQSPIQDSRNQLHSL